MHPTTIGRLESVTFKTLICESIGKTLAHVFARVIVGQDKMRHGNVIVN